jgi:hypothetical protein
MNECEWGYVCWSRGSMGCRRCVNERTHFIHLSLQLVAVAAAPGATPTVTKGEVHGVPLTTRMMSRYSFVPFLFLQV